MNYREKMRKAVSSPYDGSTRTYGEWGALRPDQRAFILRLLDEMDSADAYIKTLYQENQQSKEENEELELIVGLRQKRNLISRFDKEYDAEDKKKNPDRAYAGIMPDAEEVYKRYYKQKEIINEAIDKVQYIIDYGFDYDGFNQVDSLKGLIDMLVDYARQTKKILRGEENE